MRSTRSTNESPHSKNRNTGPMRRTVMYAAVIAAVGLFLAGLPVAGTVPPAQAQTAQDQSEWYVNDNPVLYKDGRVSMEDWTTVRSGGYDGGDYVYTLAFGESSSSENTAEWHMGRRVGTQEIQVYIPHGNYSRAAVDYEIIIHGSDDGHGSTVDQSRFRGWVTQGLYHSNGREVSIKVADNSAYPDYRQGGNIASRIAIDAVRMRCVSNCGTAPSTTTPPSSTPKISGLQDSMCFVNSNEGGGGSDTFQVSPSSARVTAYENYRYLSAEPVRGSGGSWTLRVTTHRLADDDNYRVQVTVTDGSTSVTENVTVTVEGKKFKWEPERSGIHTNKRIIALRDFTTIDGKRVRRDNKGGIIADEQNLSHCGDSWIAYDAKVFDSEVRVLGDALVKGRVHLRGRAEVSGNARVIGPSLPDRRTAKVYDNALVTGTAQVIGPVEVTRNAKVFGNARVLWNAQVTDNAEVSGNTWVYSLLRVRAQVFKNAKVFGDAHVAGNAKVSGDAHVAGNARVYSLQTDKSYTASVYGKAKVYGSAKVLNDAKIHDTARICGDAKVRDTPPEPGQRRQIASVSGDAQVSGRTELTSGNHGRGARYGDGCLNPPTPPQAPQN